MGQNIDMNVEILLGKRKKEGKWGKSSSGIEVYAKGAEMAERGRRHGIMPPRHV